MPTDSPLLRFYRSGGRDHAGRTLDEILGWDDTALEEVHDYIQWLFPLRELSRANPLAPLLAPGDIEAFRTSPALADALRRSLKRILEFYGFELIDSGGQVLISRSAQWTARSPNWLRQGNHNHLRLTRIMKSLTALGLSRHARSLSVTLLEMAADAKTKAFGRMTIRLWQEVADEAAAAMAADARGTDEG